MALVLGHSKCNHYVLHSMQFNKHAANNTECTNQLQLRPDVLEKSVHILS